MSPGVDSKTGAPQCDRRPGKSCCASSAEMPTASTSGRCCPTATAPPPPPGTFHRRSLPAPLVPFSAPSSQARLLRAMSSSTADAFFPLISLLQTQAFPASCGVTTLAVILNALSVDPGRVWQGPWRWYAESFLFCCATEEKVRKEGITLDEFVCVAECNGVVAEVHQQLSDDEARKLIIRHVSSPSGIGPSDENIENADVETRRSTFLAVSFSRRSLSQTGSGHFSPIAAYDGETDSVLVLDTARFKYPPFWVPLADLNASTYPVDPSTGSPRGFIVASRESAAGIPPPITRLATGLGHISDALGRAASQGSVWTAEALVRLVFTELDVDLVHLLLRGRACIYISDSCPQADLESIPLVRFIEEECGWETRKRRAMLVLGCLAVDKESGISAQESVALGALGAKWEDASKLLVKSVVEVAAALEKAVNGSGAL